MNIPVSAGGNERGHGRGRGHDPRFHLRRLRAARADCRSIQSFARCCSATAAGSECEPGAREAEPTTVANTVSPWLWRDRSTAVSSQRAGRSVCRRCCRGAIRGWFPNLEVAIRATQAMDALLLYERYAVSHNGTGSHIKPFACQIDAIEGKEAVSRIPAVRWRSKDGPLPQLEPSSKATDWQSVQIGEQALGQEKKEPSAAKVAPSALLVPCSSTNTGLSDHTFGGFAGRVEALVAVMMQPSSTFGVSSSCGRWLSARD